MANKNKKTLNPKEYCEKLLFKLAKGLELEKTEQAKKGYINSFRENVKKKTKGEDFPVKNIELCIKYFENLEEYENCYILLNLKNYFV